jgi:hypothetical protein
LALVVGHERLERTEIGCGRDMDRVEGSQHWLGECARADQQGAKMSPTRLRQGSGHSKIVENPVPDRPDQRQILPPCGVDPSIRSALGRVLITPRRLHRPDRRESAKFHQAQPGRSASSSVSA